MYDKRRGYQGSWFGVGGTGGTDWDGYTEFSSVSDYNENMDRVVAYYYQPNEVLEKMAEDGDTDLGGLDWEIDHYDVI